MMFPFPMAPRVRQVQNLLAFPEDFDNAAWAKATSDGTTVPAVTANYAIAPNSTMTADRVQIALPGTDLDYAIVRRSALSVSVAAGASLAQSVSLKATDASQVGKKVSIYVYDLSNAVYKAVTNCILTNDWQRMLAVHQFATGTSSVEVAFGKMRYGGGGAGTAGFPNVDASTDFLIWGAQLALADFLPIYH